MHPLLAPDGAAPRAIELHRIRLPFRRAMRSAHGTETHRESTLVRVDTVDGAVGWGECVALARPTYTGEYADAAFVVLRDVLAPAALQGAPTSVVGHPMATAALDGALIDARLRSAGVRLADAVGARRDTIPSAAVVGRMPSVDGLVAEVADLVEQGYHDVSVKIEPGWDVEPLAAIVSAWPDLRLSADANGSYRREDVAQLASLDRFGLDHLEQPLPADDLVGLGQIAGALATPVALDESVSSRGALETALALKAADAVNVKPARVGGLSAAVAIAELADEAGLIVYCGGMLETGVGRAHALAFAAREECRAPTHLGPSDRYFDHDVTTPFALGTDATLTVPGGAGIGVEPDPDRLRAVTVERAVLGRG